jgi:hypothetical protein
LRRCRVISSFPSLHFYAFLLLWEYSSHMNSVLISET